MNTFGRKKKRQNNKAFIGIIIAVGITISIYLLSIIKIPLLSNISNKLVYGIDTVVGSIIGVITQGSSYFGNTKKLNEKIEHLEEQLEQTRIDNQEIGVLETENKDLRELLNIQEKYNHFDKIYANIITRSYDNWNEIFIINKGSKDGVKEKQTVIAAGGLVGYISNVEENTSTVITILDISSAVSVEISNINKLALIKGDFSLKDKGKLKLINIPIDKELTVGEAIYTSGIGESYQKGIPVGIISEIVRKKNDIDRYAIVNLFVDIESVDMVGIILN